jgi:hypothetical protein
MRSSLRLCALLATALCAMTIEPRSAVAGRPWSVSSSVVAPGITHIRILRKRPPNRIHVLRVAVRDRPTIDVGLARPGSFGFARTSRAAVRYGAAAAVNGTFSLRTGRPYSVFARNGGLKASPLQWTRAFALTAREDHLFVGHPRLRMIVHDPLTEARWVIDSFNEPRVARGHMAVHSSVGGRWYRPPVNACSARLRRAGPPEWSRRRHGVRRLYVVEGVRCSAGRMSHRNRLVLSAHRGSAAAVAIQRLEIGQPLALEWSVGWPDTLDVLGGNPILVWRRRVIAPHSCGAYFCRRHPRTGIGMTARGEVLLVTVDGRRRRRSVGMTLAGFGHVFRRLGATEAINLDGGGSTTMTIRGRVVNRPSDPQGERRVGSIVLVHRTSRSAAVGRSRATRWSRRQSPAASAAAALAVASDPASTGGMLEAVAAGALDARQRGVPGPLDFVPGASSLASRGSRSTQ